MKETLVKWFFALGKRLFNFSRTIAAKAYDEFGDDALEIVAQVALEYGESKTGNVKFDIAKTMLKVAVPKLATVAEWLIDTVVQMAYAEYKSQQLAKDTDGDGVPDYKDLCKELGAPAGGCVTADGCPDSDCDGVADTNDKCPKDPSCA